MYPIPSSEKLAETKTCRHCSAQFPITDKDLEFYDKVSPTFNGKKYSIPTPTLCPDCRQQRRLSFRNERKLYKRNCDATGKSIISIYSPDKPFKVYHQDFWWSDKWDPLSYGKEFDFSRPFFEQFGELMREVPVLWLNNKNTLNSNYCENSEWDKNCYLLNTSYENEECYYGSSIAFGKDCIDSYWSVTNNDCYQCIKSEHSHSCFYSMNILYCHNCRYVTELENCKNCIFCVWLKNKEYHILNEPVSKEEFNKMLDDLEKNPSIRIQNHNLYKKLFLTVGLRSSHIDDSANCSGEFISNGKNCSECFFTDWSTDSKYAWDCTNVDDVYDSYFAGGINSRSQKAYETENCFYSNSAIFSSMSWYCNEISSSFLCFNSSHLFVCIGLRNKSYCILNQQYTKEEYEALVPKIIEHMKKTGEWGEFFPSSLSPFGYNETVAQEYFPITREEVLRNEDTKNRHAELVSASTNNNEWTLKQVQCDEPCTFLHWSIFNWSDYEAPFPKVKKIIPADKLPDDISKIPDDILNWAIECEVTKKPFRIIKQELDFYRKHHLPIPKRHPDQRHLDRMALRNPRKLFERKCDKCHKEMITTYAPERKEIVYCEACYNKEVIG